MLISTQVHYKRIISEAVGINIGVSVLRGVLNSGSSTDYPTGAWANENDMTLSLYHSSKSEEVSRNSSDGKLRAKKLPVYVKYKKTSNLLNPID